MFRQLECSKRYVLLSFGNKDYYLLFIYSVFLSWDSCERHFFSLLFIDQAISFPGKCTIDEPRFHANTPSKRWYIARFFLILSTPTGYEKLAGRFKLIRNGENFLNEQ